MSDNKSNSNVTIQNQNQNRGQKRNKFITPYYFFGQSSEVFAEMRNNIQKEKEELGHYIERYSVEIDVSMIKDYAKRYCRRINKAKNCDPNINTGMEDLIIYLERDMLELLLKNTNATGLMAVFAIQPDANYDDQNQTMVLIPSDDNGNAIPILGNTAIKGAEQWPRDSSTSMQHLLANINVNVDQYFHNRNIV